jgi:hypothetical protein
MMYGGCRKCRAVEEWAADLGRKLIGNAVGFRGKRAKAIRWILGLFNSQPPRHLGVEESSTGDVGLYPFSIDYKLRNGALAGAAHDFFHRARRALDIHFLVDNVVLRQKALRFAAIRTPGGRVKNEFHICYMHSIMLRLLGDY